MQDAWYKSEDSKTMLKHRITKELCGFGKKGQYWVYDDKTFKVLVYTQKTFKNLLAVAEGTPLKPKHGSESQLKVRRDAESVIKWVLKVPKHLGRQIRLSQQYK